MNTEEETNGKPFLISESDVHAHLQARMAQRGVTLTEMQQALAAGWEATDCRPGTSGRVLVFSYQAEWEGRFYEEKEVTVYYKIKGEQNILLTVKARYGQGFARGVDFHEDRV
jgi:hypothetical protein